MFEDRLGIGRLPAVPLCASTPRASNEARTRQFFVYLSNLDEEENHIGVKLSNIKYDTSNMGAINLVLDVNIDDDLELRL